MKECSSTSKDKERTKYINLINFVIKIYRSIYRSGTPRNLLSLGNLHWQRFFLRVTYISAELSTISQKTDIA